MKSFCAYALDLFEAPCSIVLALTIPGHVQIHNISVSSEDTIVPNTGENNMEVANDLSINIDDGTEVSLPEMSQFFLNPPINNESNMFT